MSMLGPYASWNKNTGYAVWDNPTAEHVGIFERINVGIKGIIHVGMWDFIEYGWEETVMKLMLLKNLVILTKFWNHFFLL